MRCAAWRVAGAGEQASRVCKPLLRAGRASPGLGPWQERRARGSQPPHRPATPGLRLSAKIRYWPPLGPGSKCKHAGGRRGQRAAEVLLHPATVGGGAALAPATRWDRTPGCLPRSLPAGYRARPGRGHHGARQRRRRRTVGTEAAGEQGPGRPPPGKSIDWRRTLRLRVRDGRRSMERSQKAITAARPGVCPGLGPSPGPAPGGEVAR